MRAFCGASVLLLAAAPRAAVAFTGRGGSDLGRWQPPPPPPRLSAPATRLRAAAFLQPLPGESADQHRRRLRELAADPAAFARAVREAKTGGAATAATASASTDRAGGAVHGGNWTPTTLRTSAPQSLPHGSDKDVPEGDAAAPGPARRKGYQRVEDWEHDQQTLLKEMRWERRVQFEGQRDGNRLQQNEILRSSLKRW